MEYLGISQDKISFAECALSSSQCLQSSPEDTETSNNRSHRPAKVLLVKPESILQNSSLQRRHFALFLHMCQGGSKTNRVMKVASCRIRCGLSKLFSLNWRPMNTPLLDCMTHRLQQEISRPELMPRGHFVPVTHESEGDPCDAVSHWEGCRQQGLVWLCGTSVLLSKSLFPAYC